MTEPIRSPGDSGIQDPDTRPTDDSGLDNPDLRTGIDNPELRTGIDNPDYRPPLLRIGLPVIVIGVVVVTVAAIVIFSQPGTPGTSTPSSSSAPNPGTKASLVLTRGLELTYNFNSVSGNVSPTSTLIAAVWTDDDANNLVVSGTVQAGTVTTSSTLSVAWAICRPGDNACIAAETDPIKFTSMAGECQLTMNVAGERVSGTFACNGLRSDDGAYTVNATGTFDTDPG